jgi:hypothetical protein
VLRFVQVNEYYITLPGTGASWQASPMIAHMLVTKPVDTLLVKVQFKDSDVDVRILQSTAGHVAIRPSNSTNVTLAVELELVAPHAVMGSIDLNIALGKFHEFAEGPHTVEVQLTSPYVKVCGNRFTYLWCASNVLFLVRQEVLTIPLGEIDLRKIRDLSAIALPDLWDGTVWQKFIDHCELIPWYEPMLESRLWWGEVFITVFSIGYFSAAYWLGPLDFTPWQKRCYNVACVSSLLFQVAFGLSVAESVSIRLVVPFALGFGVVYFISFNFTNVLILWEYWQSANEDSATDYAPGRFALWRRRPDRGRTFHSIPSSNQLNGMTRVVMIGYKPARYC